MTKLDVSTDHDGLLNQLLPLLSARGVVKRWAESATPYSDLADDCRSLVSNEEHFTPVNDFLDANPIIRLSVTSYLQQTIVASLARADGVPMPGRLLARQGVWIGRWTPNFLVVDGPLARLLTAESSPLRALLKSNYREYPTLAFARDLYNNEKFRRIRNGVAHWSFAFKHVGNEERFVCYDWESGCETVSVPILVAEAFNVASLAVIDCLDQHVFRDRENGL